jgi:hypothetical protein
MQDAIDSYENCNHYDGKKSGCSELKDCDANVKDCSEFASVQPLLSNKGVKFNDDCPLNKNEDHIVSILVFTIIRKSRTQPTLSDRFV